MFIALILRRTLHYRLKEYLIRHNLTDEDAIRALEKVLFYRHEGYWRLKDAISKQQREILTELKLELGGNQESPADKTNGKSKKK